MRDFNIGDRVRTIANKEAIGTVVDHPIPSKSKDFIAVDLDEAVPGWKSKLLQNCPRKDAHIHFEHVHEHKRIVDSYPREHFEELDSDG